MHESNRSCWSARTGGLCGMSFGCLGLYLQFQDCGRKHFRHTTTSIYYYLHLFTLYTASLKHLSGFQFSVILMQAWCSETVHSWDFLGITFAAAYILHTKRKADMKIGTALYSELECFFLNRHPAFFVVSQARRVCADVQSKERCKTVPTSYGWFRIWKDLLLVSTCPGLELPVLPEKLEDSHKFPLLLNGIYWNL